MIAAKRVTCFAVVLAALGLVPSLARAEGTKADALFREGRALLDQKKYDDACPKLADSQKLEPGAGTLLALALCHEGQGKTATAKKELEEAAALGRKVGRNDLATAAQKRAQALDPSLSKLVVRMPTSGAADYEVRCDGESVAKENLAAPLPVDPGEHKVDVSAKGKVSKTYSVRVSGAGSVELVVERLEDAQSPVAAPIVAPAPIASSPKQAPRAVFPMTEPPPAESDVRPGGAQRAVGLVVAGLGVGGFGAGAYFGGRAITEHAAAKRTCTPAPCADAQAANDRSKAALGASIASVTAGTGALALGTILYFTAPSAPPKVAAGQPIRAVARIVPDAGPTQVGVGVVGTF